MAGCTWCSLVRQVISTLIKSAQTYEISLRVNPRHVIMPLGSNLYLLNFTTKSGTWSTAAHLEFFTEYENFAAPQVTARELDQGVTPSRTSPQILRWLKECDQHPCCPQQTDSPLPTRLIEVATTKICHTNGAFGKFVALSYCWGTGSQIQLRSDTIETLSQHLDFGDLPQTIKDAVLVTRSLSIPYLLVCWVLPFCRVPQPVCLMRSR